MLLFIHILKTSNYGHASSLQFSLLHFVLNLPSPWDQVIKSHVAVCLFDQQPAVPCDQVELALAMAREEKN